MEEKNYDHELRAQQTSHSVPKLNSDQRRIYDLIIDVCGKNHHELLFVYGHRGTGKTFLWKTIIESIRSQGQIVSAVASSGIASLLFPSGRTTHSSFKLPLELTDESLCHAKKHSQLADLLIHNSLIIWDEAPMNDKRCFEMLDWTLNDLMTAPDNAFGGKSILLGGDFRQTLPMKKGAMKHELMHALIASSYLWSYFRVHTMRLLRPELTTQQRQRAERFGEWLLNIGDGRIGGTEDADDGDTFHITVPEEHCIYHGPHALSDLIRFIYDDVTLTAPTVSTFQEKPIVCPKSETADAVNKEILSLIDGKGRTYFSRDATITVGKETSEAELLYPTKYLNTLAFTGFPPYELLLKVGSPIMMLPNMNLSCGLCNGTRMIVISLMSKLIEAQIITGTRVGEKVYIHRIPLTHKDPNLSFTFKCTQFPIKICYAMTINKSQGSLYLNRYLAMVNYTWRYQEQHHRMV